LNRRDDPERRLKPRLWPGKIALHWLTALLLVAAATLGQSVLTCARLEWRLGHPAPAQLDSIPGWQSNAWLAHAALYVLLLLSPFPAGSTAPRPASKSCVWGFSLFLTRLPRTRRSADASGATHVALNFTLLSLVSCPWRSRAMAPFGRSRRRAEANAALSWILRAKDF